MKKSIFAVLLFFGFFLTSTSSYAAFSCPSSASFAGNYSGVFNGAVGQSPFSGFAFIAINSSGQIALVDYFNQFGAGVGLLAFWTGTVQIVNTVNCLLVGTITNAGTTLNLVIKMANNGNTMLFSSPFDSNQTLSGVAWRD